LRRRCGARARVFSVVHALPLEPLPYPHPDRVGLLQRHVSNPRGESRDIGADGQMRLTVRDKATAMS
jgi:hypothetical protein